MTRIAVLSTAILAGLALPPEAAELTVRVTGAAPASGQVLISVFDDAAAWMATPAASRAVAIGGDGTATAPFDLASGPTAVALIHDRNGNGRIDSNALGIHTEAFGFSNGARARFGPPRFERASFALPAGGAAITIPLDRAD